MAKKTFNITVDFYVPQSVYMQGVLRVEAATKEEAMEICEKNKDNTEFLRGKVTTDDIDWEFKMGNVLDDIKCGKVKDLEFTGNAEED